MKIINPNWEKRDDDDDGGDLFLLLGRVMILLSCGGVVYLMNATTRQNNGTVSMWEGTSWLCATVRTTTTLSHGSVQRLAVALTFAHFSFPEASVPVAGTNTAYFPREQDCLTTLSSSQLRGAVLQVFANELKAHGVDGEPQLCLLCGRT